MNLKESSVWETSYFEVASQPAIACSKLAIETLEQGVKYVQSYKDTEQRL